MSTLLRSPTMPETPHDPFRLGWRYVNEKNNEGDTIVRQVPLTEEDVLHPQEEDFIVNTPLHDDCAGYLKLGIESQTVDKKGVVVLGNTRVDWGSRSGLAHGPDVAVFDGVKGNWIRTKGNFYLKRTKGRARLVIEVTSPATWANDFGPKLREYFKVGVPAYVIVDVPQGNDLGDISLFAFEAGKTQFEPVPRDDQGRIWLDAVELWLGAEGLNLYLEDAHGERLPPYCELREQAESWKKKALAAEKRIVELEKKLARRDKS